MGGVSFHINALEKLFKCGHIAITFTNRALPHLL